MTTELTLINEDELNALAAEMGASAEDLQGGNSGFLPQLKVWLEDDGDEENAPRLKGKMYLTNQDTLVYAKQDTVVFRPLTHVFQWTQWDNKAKKTIGRTRMITNFKEEARDDKGTIRCGKPPSKDLKDNKALQEKYDDITTYRRVQGLVSYRGIDKDGNEHTVTDALCVINLKGVNFNPFQNEYIDVMPAKSNLWDWQTKITLDRKKNGSVTYWELHFNPDFDNKQRMTKDVFDTVRALKEKIDTFNKDIDEAYYNVIHGRTTDKQAMEALKTVGGLSDDFNEDEEIPF